MQKMKHDNLVQIIKTNYTSYSLEQCQLIFRRMVLFVGRRNSQYAAVKIFAVFIILITLLLFNLNQLVLF